MQAPGSERREPWEGAVAVLGLGVAFTVEAAWLVVLGGGAFWLPGVL
jgi:hypothetical protein